MKQYEVVELITTEFSKIPEVKFICLDGSLIIQEEDSFSDINYTVGIDYNYYSRFIDRLLDLLEIYDTILYHKQLEKNKFVFVYDDGIIVKLNITDIKDIKLPNKYCVLYDVDSRLENLEIELNKIPDIQLADLINGLSLKLIDFKKSFLRKDVVYAMDLTSRMISETGLFLRAIDNPSYANFSLNKCFDSMSTYHRVEYAKVIKEFRYNNLLPCVQLLVLLLSKNIQTLPIEMAQHINYDLFNYAKKELFSIERK